MKVPLHKRIARRRAWAEITLRREGRLESAGEEFIDPCDRVPIRRDAPHVPIIVRYPKLSRPGNSLIIINPVA